jgi:putative transcriptional regulator
MDDKSGIVECPNRVREYRLARGITQKQLANVVSVSRRTIQKIERGDHAPSVLTAQGIAHFLGVSTDEVFTRRRV